MVIQKRWNLVSHSILDQSFFPMSLIVALTWHDLENFLRAIKSSYKLKIEFIFFGINLIHG